MRITGVKYGEVISIDDQHGADMITVRVYPEDNSKKDNDRTMTAFPLLPKMLHVKPKVGEGVLILFAVWSDGNSQRYYIGPVISQPHRMYNEPWFMGGDTYQRGAFKPWDVNPLLAADAEGIYPKDDDISIVGRKNCDIQIKDDDIRIRAGVKLVDNNYCVKYNRTNPAYIKLKYHEHPVGEDIKSTATIVADKINLLSNKSTEVSIEDNTEEGRRDLITDEKLNKVLEDAYSLPYGEKLVELLKTMIEIFNQHTHDYIALPPNAAFVEKMTEAANEPLYKRKLLSGTVKIN